MASGWAAGGSSSHARRLDQPAIRAGLGPMSGELPGAGVRFRIMAVGLIRGPSLDGHRRSEAENQLRKMMPYSPVDSFDREKPNYGRAIGAFDIWLANWRTDTANSSPGRLPCPGGEAFHAHSATSSSA